VASPAAIAAEERIHVLLVDRDGAVLRRGAGRWSAGAQAELEKVLAR